MKIFKNKIILIKEKEYIYEKKINSMADVANFVRNIIHIQEEIDEVLYLLNLDTNNTINSFMEISRGGLNTCFAEKSDIFKKVLINNCKKFIIVHNHPSGNSKPSNEDIRLTNSIKEGCKKLDLELVDHIIVCCNEYSSCIKKSEKFDIE